MEMENMFLENQSKFEFEDTVNRLEETIKNGGWGVKHIHNLEGMLQEKGFDILPAKVLEICKPPHANKLLSKDELRIYSNMMPCRLSVYEKEDGKTYVSRMNNGLFAKMIGGDVEEVMETAYLEVEDFIEDVSIELEKV